MAMMSPPRGNPMIMMLDDMDENDGIEYSNNRAMSDYLDDVAASSPMSLTSIRSQGFGLCNTRTQLLKVNALYNDEEEEDDSLNRSLDHSREYSLDKSREESDFYLKACVSREDRNSMSPLYAASSLASSDSSVASSCDPESDQTESDFLIEARASLRALDEWQDMGDFPNCDEDDVSSCDASCNSSYDGDEDVKNSFDALSACAFNEFLGNSHPSTTTPRSCPDIFASKRSQQRHAASTKSWLQEIKDEELEQRKRIAQAIALSSNNNSSQSSRRRSLSKAVLKNPAKLFRNKDNIDHKHNVSKDNSKAGRHTLMRSIRSWQSPTSFGRRSRRSSFEGDYEERDDNNDFTAHTVSSTNGSSQDSSPDVATKHNDKELQMKRAFLGSARVVTMDGIVESFADDAAYRSTALSPKPSSRRMEFAPTSEGPLTWV
eukprot:CAMPEP_0116134854 /NCGR_PEP_ID=MMETSP0329-20121206/10873_1 /TAXON_ID=697910 /ORGANISM="Pseudo-nitzschia arenysensis, Strain B593" /LENGTH=432 /DNA_ID=CAMNT_0003629603 /DNA_START=11 /DNA_END=1310 /DNA_ORIENTATION=-